MRRWSNTRIRPGSAGVRARVRPPTGVQGRWRIGILPVRSGTVAGADVVNEGRGGRALGVLFRIYDRPIPGRSRIQRQAVTMPGDLSDEHMQALLEHYMRRFRVPNPEAAAGRVAVADDPTRQRLLERLWPELVDGWAKPGALRGVAGAASAVGAGAPLEDLVLLARAIAARTLFDVFYFLEDEGGLLPEEREALPRWRLASFDPKGRFIGGIDGLHESVNESDPSGREGEDLWD